MIAVKWRMASMVIALGALVLSGMAAEVQAKDSGIDPEAARILKRSTDFLGGLKSFSLNTESMVEDVLESGMKVQRDFTARIVIQRPNKLRAERTGDLSSQLMLYDGKTLTVYNPEDGYYAVIDAPADIDALLHFARETLDIVPPSGDLVFTNSFDLLTATASSGMVVGKSMVDGVRCDQLAFRGPLVDWQIWIADGAKPLPLKYVLTTTNDPALPQYILLMNDWNIAPLPNEAQFSFSVPKDATKIDFVRMDTSQTSGP